MNLDEDRTLLSICIATFNRGEMLEKTLAVLVGQMSPIRAGNVEIVIGDNCSSDGTEEIGRRYSEKYPYIKYLRHASNLGAERNFFTVVQHAAGGFIWLLSDDDFILDGAIQRILQAILRQPDVSLIFINYKLLSDTSGGSPEPSRCIATADSVTNSADEFCLLVRYANSFIASCIYKRIIWLNVAPAHYSGNNYWPQLYIANEIVRQEKSFILSDPLLMMRCLPPLASRTEKKRQGNDHFYMDAHLMFAKFVDEASDQLTSLAAKNLGYELAVKDNFFQIVIYKYVAEKYRPRYLTYVFHELLSVTCFWNNILFWLRDVPVLFLPRIVSVGIYEWWRIKAEISKWEKADKRYRRMIFSLYKTISLFKRLLKKSRLVLQK